MSDDKLDAILNDYDLVREDLNCECKQSLLDRMAKEIVGEWYLSGRALSVELNDLKAIKKDNVNASEPEEKSIAMLDKWADQYGEKATCLKLVEGFLRRNNRIWVEIVCEEIAREKSHQKTKLPPGPSGKGSSHEQGAQKSNGSQQNGKKESEAPTNSGTIINLDEVPSNVVPPARPQLKNIKVVKRNHDPEGTYYLQFTFDHESEEKIEVSVTKSAEQLTFKIVKCEYLQVDSESEYSSDFTVENKACESVFEDIVKGKQLSETQLRFLLDNVVSVVTKKIHYASHPPQYGIFLSHKSKDKPIINAVKEGLQFMGYKTWIDQEDIGAGEVSIRAMKSGIDKCASFLAWMNEEFFGSEFCKSELKYALQKDKIIFTFGNHHKVSEFFTGDFGQLGDRNIVDPSEKSFFEILRLIDDALHK